MRDLAPMRETIDFTRAGPVPNSPLPVLLHRQALGADAGAALHEGLFARHGWTNAWRNGVYRFHHFHSTAHEVLGIAGGRAVLRLGGEPGRDVEVSAGDVIVLPAGTGHRLMSSAGRFLVVGAYPEGRTWDLLDAGTLSDVEVSAAVQRIAAVPVPALDPVTGQPLSSDWPA